MNQLSNELRPFQINAAEAIALLNVIQPRLQAILTKYSFPGGAVQPFDYWDLKELEEYILLRDTLVKLHEVTKGVQP